MRKFLLLSYCFILASELLTSRVYAGGSLPPPSPSTSTNVALDFTDFVVFGNNRVVIGRGVDLDDEVIDPDDPDDLTTINGGNLGSNRNLYTYGRTQTEGIFAGEDYHAGREIQVDGDIVANSEVRIYSDSHIAGDIDSGGDLYLGSRTNVGGDITAAGDMFLGTGIVIGGTQASGGTPDVYVPVTLPPQTVFGAGAVDVRSGSNETVTLLPGSYDDVLLGSYNVLNLTSGKYYLDSFHLGAYSIINLDLSGGSFEMHLVRDVKLGRYTTMFLTNGTPDQVLWDVGTSWHSYGYATLYGTVFAQNDIVIGRGNNITGALYAADQIHIYGNSVINFDLYCELTHAGCDDPPITSAVPEPGTMALLGSGLLGAFRFRRKKT